MSEIDQVVIAHISDLHFGTQYQLVHQPGRRPHRKKLCARLQLALDRVRNENGLASDEPLRLLISGDLTSGGAEHEFMLVNEYLMNEHPVKGGDSYGLGISLAKNHFALASIAGNHDHWKGNSWPQVPAFNAALYGPQITARLDLATWWSPGRNLKVEVYAIDSSGGLRDEKHNRNAIGKLDPEDLDRLRALLQSRNSDSAHRVAIICCHHSLAYNQKTCPQTASQYDEATGANSMEPDSCNKLLEIAKEHEVSAVLTGHVHQFIHHPHRVSLSGQRIPEFTSSTTVQEPEKLHRNGFWVHRICLMASVPASASTRYEWNRLTESFERRNTIPWV